MHQTISSRKECFQNIGWGYNLRVQQFVLNKLPRDLIEIKMKRFATLMFTLPTAVLILSIFAALYFRQNDTIAKGAPSFSKVPGAKLQPMSPTLVNLTNSNLPQFFPRLAKSYKWRAFDWDFETGIADRYIDQIEIEFRRSKYSSFMYTDTFYKDEGYVDSSASNGDGNVINREEEFFTSTLGNFLRKLGSIPRSDAFFYYFTHPLEGKLSKVLSSLLPEIKLRRVHDRSSNLESNGKSAFPFTSIWIGSKGATTRLHYDIPDNLFVQIKGEKIFYLYPPSLALKFYPYLHPAARKSRLIDILNKNITDTVALKEVEKVARKIVLKAGDVLYLPSMHAHHVVASENSISINIFSESSILQALDEMERHPIPFESSWTREELQIGTHLWLREILLYFYGGDIESVQQYIIMFRQATYLDHDTIDSKLPDVDFQCFQQKMDGNYSFLNNSKIRSRVSSFIRIFHKYGILNSIDTPSQAGSKKKDRALAEVIRQGRLELILGRYLEGVVYNFVLDDNQRSGGKHNGIISKFLKHCFLH